jgi:hypothetical protein
MSWYYSANLGLLMVDKTLPANMVPTPTQGSLYPAIMNTSNAVGIMTGASNSNIPYTLTVGGTGFFSNNLYLRDNNNYLTYSSNSRFEGPIVLGNNGGSLSTSTNTPLYWNSNNIIVSVPLSVSSNLNIRDSNNFIRFTSNANYQGIECIGVNGGGLGGPNNISLFWRPDSVTVNTPLFTSALSNLGSIFVASNLNIRNNSNYIRYDSNVTYQGLEMLGQTGGGLGTLQYGQDISLYWDYFNVTSRKNFIASSISSPLVTTDVTKTNLIQLFGSSNDFISYASNQAYVGTQIVSRFGGALCTIQGPALYWNSNGDVSITGNLNVSGTINGPNGTSLNSYSKYNPLTRIQFRQGPLHLPHLQVGILDTGVLLTNLKPAALCSFSFTVSPYNTSNARLNMTGFLSNIATAGYYFEHKIMYSSNQNAPANQWHTFSNEQNNGDASIKFYNVRSRDYGLTTSVSDWFRYPTQLLLTNTPIYFGVMPVVTGYDNSLVFTNIHAHLDVY